MRIFLFLAALLSALAGALIAPAPAQAGRGIPGSPEFGYGARLELDGPYLEEALELAADTHFDWLAVTLRWNTLQTDAAYSARLDQVMAFAARNSLAVMISLTQPPTAALTATGPDPAQTAALLTALSKRYGSPFAAVELFPGANTRAGWGANPDPNAYAQFYNQVQSQLQSAALPLLLVGCGLQPLSGLSTSGDLHDLEFLSRVYQAGAYPPVISVLLNNVTGDPLAAPGSGQPVLRHYEEIRQVMVSAGQEKALLWITAFRAPSGTISSSVVNSAVENEQQNVLLYQMMAQMRSQLYIGVAFYESLNPASNIPTRSALIPSDSQYHPFVAVFREIVSHNGGLILLPRYGRSKDQGIEKPRP